MNSRKLCQSGFGALHPEVSEFSTARLETLNRSHLYVRYRLQTSQPHGSKRDRKQAISNPVEPDHNRSLSTVICLGSELENHFLSQATEHT